MGEVIFRSIGLTFYRVQVFVLGNLETIHDETVRIVITPDGVQQSATGDKISFRYAAFPDNHLPAIGRYRIRVHIEIARYAVYLYGLIDIAGDYPVVISFLREVTVIVERTLIGKEQRTFDVAFDGVLVRRQGEEQFVKTLHVLPCFNRTVLCQVL